jgi:hypothetical protein
VIANVPNTTMCAPVTNEELNRAFLTTLLLTGSAKQAEVAILDAISEMRPEESCDGLFLDALRAAVRLEAQAPARVEEPGYVPAILPLELQRVLHLPLDLRRCFVLRVLVGLPREECSRLLQVDSQHVDEGARGAMRELVGLEQPYDHSD